MAVKILIIDDHKVVRDGVAMYLENDPEFEIVALAGSGEEGVKVVEHKAVDLVILDINMDGGIDGIKTAKQISAISSEIKIMALTMHNDYQHIKAMMEAGAKAYVLKSCDEIELKSAIQKVTSGGIFYSDEVAQTVMNNMVKKTEMGQPGQKSDVHFTKREKEIYRLILEEFSNQEIADKLFISVRTVEVHKRNLIEKTGAKNSTGLVLYAIKNHLFEGLS